MKNLLGYLVVILLVGAAVWGVTNQVGGSTFATQFTAIIAFSVLVLAGIVYGVKAISPTRQPFN